MIVYLARAIQAFVMYCVNGTSRSSLLIESTDSMINIIYIYIYTSKNFRYNVLCCFLCQVMLRACAGMDYRELLQMLCLLAGPRLEEVRALSSAGKPAHFQALELFVAKAWSSEGLDFFGREFLGLVQHEEPQDRRLALSHTKGKLHPTPSMVLQYTPLIERLSSLLQNCSGLEAGCESEPPAQGLLNLLPDNIKELALHNEATSVSYTTTSTAWIIIIYEIQKINDIIVEMTTDRDLQALLPWTASLF